MNEESDGTIVVGHMCLQRALESLATRLFVNAVVVCGFYLFFRNFEETGVVNYDG